MGRNVLISMCLSLLTLEAYADIAAASFFKEMRAQNPAVLSQRPAATFSLLGRMDKIEKVQDVSSSNTLSSSTTDVDITNTSFFYGGKGSGLFTTEISGELGSGKKIDKASTPSSTSERTTESDLMILNAATGIGKFFGVGFMRITEDRTQTELNSETPGSTTYDTTLTAMTAGARVKLGLDVGFFYQHSSFEQNSVSEDGPRVIEMDMPRVGAAVGLSTKTFHLEAGYVKNLKSISEDQGGGAGAGSNIATYNPAKFTGTVEAKIGKLSVGLTSNYYMEGFFDFNNLIYYTMVLSRNQENRLENTFNFSLGADKGHAFSGSVTYSTVESQELPPNLSSGVKFKTTSKIMGVQLSYAYAF